MPIEPADFKRALGQFASGVAVVTTRGTVGEPRGLTVNSFCSVSLTPPLVLVCIDNRSDIHADFRSCGVFAVSVLAEDQEDVSQRFATQGNEKFTGADPVGRLGVVLVPGALAHIECRTAAVHPAGDHRIYIGEVEELTVRPGRPLLYHSGRYYLLADEHRLPVKDGVV